MNKAFKILLIIGIVLISVGFLTAGSAVGLSLAEILPKNSESYIERVFTTSEMLENIDIKSAEMSIKLEVATGDECRVVYSQPQDASYEIGVENGTLKADLRNDNYWFMNFLSLGRRSSDITVYITEHEYNEINIENVSGSISIGNLSSETLQIKTVSGDISLEGIKVQKEFTVNTASGKIITDYITAHNEDSKSNASIGAVSGDIFIYNSDYDNLSVSSTSGKVELKVTGAHITNVKTTSGDIEFYRFGTKEDGAQINFETVSGEVEGTLSYAMLYDVTTTSGEVKLYDQDPNGNICKVKTVSGDITISVYGKEI